MQYIDAQIVTNTEIKNDYMSLQVRYLPVHTQDFPKGPEEKIEQVKSDYMAIVHKFCKIHFPPIERNVTGSIRIVHFLIPQNQNTRPKVNENVLSPFSLNKKLFLAKFS